MNYLTFVFPEYVKSVDTVLWCVFGGVIVGALISVFFKEVLGAFIRFLLKEGADSPQSAITLENTRFSKNPFVKHAIKNGTYKRVLKYVEPEGDEALKPSLAILKRSYYIPQELTFDAENIFSKKGTNWLSLVLTIVLFLIVTILSLIFVPDIIVIFSTFFGLS